MKTEYPYYVVNENNFFKFKLTQKDRRLLKKTFGEKGYKRFLYLNSKRMFSVRTIELIRQICMEE